MDQSATRQRLAIHFAGLAVSIAGSLYLPSTLRADEPKHITWREDLAQAQEEARSRDTLLWMQFTGPWCINCRRMERSTFTHSGVVSLASKSFVPVKLRSDEHENLAVSLGLTTLPSTVIVRPNGEVVDRYEGYIEPENFEATLLSVLQREERLPEQVEARKLKARPLALEGFCPVTLLNENRLVEGRKEFKAEHDLRTFRFASEAARAEFLRQPERYTPANNGECTVSQVEKGQLLAGNPRWGVVYSGHLFLFRSGEERQLFAKEPERYARVDRSDRFNCTHCFNRLNASRQPMSAALLVMRREVPNLPPPERLEALLAPSTTIRR